MDPALARARITGAKELSPPRQHQVRPRASLIHRTMLTIRAGKRMLLAGDARGTAVLASQKRDHAGTARLSPGRWTTQEWMVCAQPPAW